MVLCGCEGLNVCDGGVCDGGVCVRDDCGCVRVCVCGWDGVMEDG